MRFSSPSRASSISALSASRAPSAASRRLEAVFPCPSLGRDVLGLERVAVHAAQFALLEQAEPIGVLVDRAERLADVGEHVDTVGRAAVHRPDELVEHLGLEARVDADEVEGARARSRSLP